MTNSKTLKRALFASIISMVLCLTMLIGSTYAWFTDSVTAGKTTILAGNLHIKVQTSTDLEIWEDVDDKTEFFKGCEYWEPGHVEYVPIRVENVGDMAVKYKISLKEIANTIGYTKDDAEIDLAKYLHFAVLKMSEWTDGSLDDPAEYVWGIIKATQKKYITQNEGREWLLEVLEHNDDSHSKLSDSPYMEGILKGANAPGKYTDEAGNILTDDEDNEIELKTVSDPYLLVVYMPKDVKNEANYGLDEGDQPSIELGVNVEAKQFTYEEDAFNNQYDASATYDGNIAAPTSPGGSTGGSTTGNGRDISLTITVGMWQHAIPGLEYDDEPEIPGM